MQSNGTQCGITQHRTLLVPGRLSAVDANLFLLWSPTTTGFASLWGPALSPRHQECCFCYNSYNQQVTFTPTPLTDTIEKYCFGTRSADTHAKYYKTANSKQRSETKHRQNISGCQKSVHGKLHFKLNLQTLLVNFSDCKSDELIHCNTLHVCITITVIKQIHFPNFTYTTKC